jgi:5-methylcytosine-specific restriction protein A
VVEVGKRFCGDHRKQEARRSGRVRPSAAQRGYDSTWRKLRKLVLAEEPLCADPFGAHAHTGQVVPATDVDHIVPIAKGGTNTRGNLLCLCHSCHSRKTMSEMKRVQRRSTIPVTVIAGPPGAGKTTLVKELAGCDDLIVDVDALFHALSGLPWYEKPVTLLPFVLAARDAVIQRLGRASKVRHAWIITSEGKRDKLMEMKRALGAEVKVMETSVNECMRRIHNDGRRKDKAEMWRDLVDKWWEDWQGVEGRGG